MAKTFIKSLRIIALITYVKIEMFELDIINFKYLSLLNVLYFTYI